MDRQWAGGRIPSRTMWCRRIQWWRRDPLARDHRLRWSSSCCPESGRLCNVWTEAVFRCKRWQWMPRSLGLRWWQRNEHPVMILDPRTVTRLTLKIHFQAKAFLPLCQQILHLISVFRSQILLVHRIAPHPGRRQWARIVVGVIFQRTDSNRGLLQRLHDFDQRTTRYDVDHRICQELWLRQKKREKWKGKKTSVIPFRFSSASVLKVHLHPVPVKRKGGYATFLYWIPNVSFLAVSLHGPKEASLLHTWISWQSVSECTKAVHFGFECKSCLCV